LYMFDVNNLPTEAKVAISEGQTLENVINNMKPKDVLSAVVARSIIKLGQHENNPTLFIEPIYTVMNKGDHIMDRTVIEFLSEFVAKPMGAKIAKSQGKDEVFIPASSNPEGQYEDGAYGNAAHGGQGIQTGTYSLVTSILKDFSETSTFKKRYEDEENNGQNDQDLYPQDEQEQEELSEGEHIQNDYDGGRNTTRPGTQPELVAESADEATIREYIEKQGKEAVPKLGSLLKR